VSNYGTYPVSALTGFFFFLMKYHWNISISGDGSDQQSLIFPLHPIEDQGKFRIPHLLNA
jgi:hypothetical protein